MTKQSAAKATKKDPRAVARAATEAKAAASSEIPQVTSQQAAAALQFLQRAQLTGAEVPTYLEVFNVLSAIAAPLLVKKQFGSPS